LINRSNKKFFITQDTSNDIDFSEYSSSDRYNAIFDKIESNLEEQKQYLQKLRDNHQS